MWFLFWQLADMELKEFLASDESESDDSEEGDDTEDKSAKKKKKQDRYRALLQSGEGSDGNNEDDDQDMEVTFNTGLEDLSKRILEKKDKQSETVWEAVLRKKKEKKKARKGKSKDSSDDETSDSDQEPIEEPEDFFIEEPSKDSQHQSTRKGKQSVEASEEAEASRAELELLLADDKGGDANLKGYNMKPKKAKGKKGKELPNEDKLPSIDYEDPRFSSLFKSPLFALDPTDPQFKRYIPSSCSHQFLFVYQKTKLAWHYPNSQKTLLAYFICLRYLFWLLQECSLCSSAGAKATQGRRRNREDKTTAGNSCTAAAIQHIRGSNK